GQKAVLIAGGVGKGQDFTPLAQAASQYARAVVLIGQDASLIKQALHATADNPLPLHEAVTLSDAIYTAFELAHEGDAVLLSPACASLDMFSNYRARG